MNKSCKFIIYGLIDPFTDELRYIGKSSTGLKRPYAHFQSHALKKYHDHCHNWIRKVISQGKKPLVEIIFEFDSIDKLNDEEIRIISLFKCLGYNLTNMTKGGDGSPGRIFTEETKNKISLTKKGKIPWNKNKKQELTVTENLASKNRKKIKCVNDGKIFESAKGASKYYQISYSAILNTARGVYEAVRGLKFIFVDKKLKCIENKDLEDKNIPNFNREYKISVLCENDQKQFPSIKAAAKYYKIDKNKILRVLARKQTETREGLRFSRVN